MKTCTRCGGLGPFHKNRNRRDGLQIWCTSCQKEVRRARRDADPQRVCGLDPVVKTCTKCGGFGPFYKNKSRSDGLSVWCKDCTRNDNKTRYDADLKKSREKTRENSRKQRLINPENIRKSRRKWDAAHPVQLRAKSHARRVRELGASGYATHEQIQARIDYYGNCCAYCGGPYEHLDHVIPLSKGGTAWPANLRPACQPCNHRKHIKQLHEWKLAYLKLTKAA